MFNYNSTSKQLYRTQTFNGRPETVVHTYYDAALPKNLAQTMKLYSLQCDGVIRMFDFTKVLVTCIGDYL